jgi:hypothetical protein
MFAGHVGAGLAIGRLERRINVGVFIFAAVFIDFALWLFVLFGWESVTIPANYAATHQPEFIFPFSHGLLAAIVWSVLAGITAYLLYPRLAEARFRAAALAAAAVFSHWLLDALVHVPELPVAGDHSVKVGLGLWQSMRVALAAEALIAAAGLYLFLSGAGLSRTKKLGLMMLCLVVLASTVIGMTVAPPPPSVNAMAMTSLVTIAVVGALAGWLGKRPA